MKTQNDPRHLERIKVMQELFSWEFNHQETELTPTTLAVIENLEMINNSVLEAAPTWPIEKINKIDLSILRLAIFELLIKKDVPPKVVVDEAVELAKGYGSESSAGFINGVLGKIITNHQITT